MKKFRNLIKRTYSKDLVALLREDVKKMDILRKGKGFVNFQPVFNIEDVNFTAMCEKKKQKNTKYKDIFIFG